MAKDTKQGGQMTLIDVGPKESKKILEIADAYRAAQRKRIKALADEVKHKQSLLAMVANSKLKRMEDGRIQFRVDDIVITVTPSDDKVKIRVVVTDMGISDGIRKSVKLFGWEAREFQTGHAKAMRWEKAYKVLRREVLGYATHWNTLEFGRPENPESLGHQVCGLLLDAVEDAESSAGIAHSEVDL